MMLVPSLISLTVASLAFCLSVNTTEEIVKVAATVLAAFCVILSVIFAPWMVKLALLAIPFLSQKLNPA
ncbi:hypothetical protein [Laspinema olomoucense]|uniref:Uncharacterized protein n=1 Tax=Laspinema olomoucense D3b TaxID=2953688 RepID=A0ABT2N251_9CYAN|nr:MULTISPECIES: hypothetical protein [unclassified Laspinema]MCT7976763.1 hypothetical protein [Laspinema sp. D3b]MCT7991720.1 hypothetical protein [Laspinema sp. D3a]MCT7994926.1 hypothetical protein [Laspinema sp. D3c]